MKPRLPIQGTVRGLNRRTGYVIYGGPEGSLLIYLIDLFQRFRFVDLFQRFRFVDLFQRFFQRFSFFDLFLRFVSAILFRRFIS